MLLFQLDRQVLLFQLDYQDIRNRLTQNQGMTLALYMFTFGHNFQAIRLCCATQVQQFSLSLSLPITHEHTHREGDLDHISTTATKVVVF